MTDDERVATVVQCLAVAGPANAAQGAVDPSIPGLPTTCRQFVDRRVPDRNVVRASSGVWRPSCTSGDRRPSH